MWWTRIAVSYDNTTLPAHRSRCHEPLHDQIFGPTRRTGGCDQHLREVAVLRVKPKCFRLHAKTTPVQDTIYFVWNRRENRGTPSIIQCNCMHANVNATSSADIAEWAAGKRGGSVRAGHTSRYTIITCLSLNRFGRDPD